MSPNTDAGRAHEAGAEAYAELRIHKDTQPYRAIVAWLDALATQQQIWMTTCAPDRLPAAQIRLKQLIAQRDALVRPIEAGNTGHVFD